MNELDLLCFVFVGSNRSCALCFGLFSCQLTCFEEANHIFLPSVHFDLSFVFVIENQVKSLTVKPAKEINNQLLLVWPLNIVENKCPSVVVDFSRPEVWQHQLVGKCPRFATRQQ